MTRPDSQIIMVVEDSDDDYEATERALKGNGRLNNPLIRFENGEDAILYLTADRSGGAGKYSPLPGLLLLDLNIPGKGGTFVLGAIKSTPRLARIPVIVLTTSDNLIDVERCYDLGANTYIRKPVELGEFFNVIQRLRDYWLDLALLPAETS
jgi:CheY-like chemotaxis protein